MTVQRVNSDEPVDKQKLIKIIFNLDKIKIWLANQILHGEALRANVPNICHGSF